MIVTFYKTADDPKRLNKTLLTYHDLDPENPSNDTWQKTYVINNTEGVDLINPNIILGYKRTIDQGENQSPLIENFDTNVNYALMSGRYYFVNNITLGTGGKIYVNMSVDVLGTYADGIKNACCCITRSASADLNWVTDTKFPINPSLKDFGKSINFGDSAAKFTGEDSYLVEVAEFEPYNWVNPNT